MKKILLSLTIMTLLVSCGGSEEKVPSEKSEQSEKDDIQDIGETKDSISEEETEEEVNYLNDISLETTNSDCYIVGHFSSKDADYITVDFVNYKVIEGDSEPEYELVNEIKTLRTFKVGTEYFDCARSEKKVSIDKLIEQSEQDKETLFNIDTDGGSVVELFVETAPDNREIIRLILE